MNLTKILSNKQHYGVDRYQLQLDREPRVGAGEAFADLFAAINGGAGIASKTQLLLQYFPRATKEIKYILGTLPALNRVPETTSYKTATF